MSGATAQANRTGYDPLGPGDLVMSAVPVRQVPLLDRLAPAKRAGFAGISVGIEDYAALRAGGMAAAEICARIADAGLVVCDVECVGNWLPGHGAATGAYAEALAEMTAGRGVEVAAELGARGLLVVEMLGVQAPDEVATEAFAAVCDLAAPAGVIVHLEAARFGGVPRFADARRIVAMAGRDNGALTIDPWHFFRDGNAADDLHGLPAAQIGCVQLCDAPLTGTGDPLRETTSARLLPGEGEFDLTGLVRALDTIGSTAPISVEVFNRRQRAMSIDAIAEQWAASTRAVLQRARTPAAHPELLP